MASDIRFSSSIQHFDEMNNRPDVPMVTIFVGSDPNRSEEPFEIPRDIAIEASPVFRGAFDGENWLEKDEQGMVLEDIEPQTFEMLCYYIDTRGLKMPTFRSLGTPSEALVKYAKLWMLADRLIMHSLQNTVSSLMQAYISKVGLDQCEGLMHLLYGRDSEHSVGERDILRKILRFKFYASRPKDLANCGYTILPELMQALTTTHLDFNHANGLASRRWDQTGPNIDNSPGAAVDVGQTSMVGVPVGPERKRRYNLRSLNSFDFLQDLEEIEWDVYDDIVKIPHSSWIPWR
jgi:hypothetical protein